MQPVPDHGEQSYEGNRRLEGKVALIMGADSGIGNAMAIAFAREGADVVISFLKEFGDAEDTARWVRDAGRRAVVSSGDITSEDHCKELVQHTVRELGSIDILANNAPVQRTYADTSDIC